MSASSSVKTGIQARMNRIEQRDRVKQSKTRKPINLLRWVILIACVLVVPEFLRTLVFARPRGDDQFADCTFSPSLDMSR